MLKISITVVILFAGCVFPSCQTFAQARTTGAVSNSGLAAKVPTFSSRGRHWRFSNRQFAGAISRQTGLLTKLTSLKPTPVNVIPAGGIGLRITVKNMENGRLAELGSLESARISEGEKRGAKFERIECVIRSAPLGVATAKVHYDIFDGYLRIKITVTSDRTYKSPCRVFVSQGFNSAQWPQQAYSWGPEPSTDRVRLQYSYKKGEMYNRNWGFAMYPAGILMRKDRCFLWGYLNLNSYVVLAPNTDPDRIPEFMINPKGVKKGESYTFDFVYKTTAPSATAALRWYVKHMYDSDPFFNEGPVRLTHRITRTTPKGNFVDYRMPHPGYSQKTYARVQSMMLKLKLTNIWFRGWNNWRETAPTHGRWFNGHEWLTVQSVRREINNLHRKGFKVYLYFRQGWLFKSSELNSSKGMEKPPYRRWLNRTSNGKLEVLSENPPSLAQRKALGWPKGEQEAWVETDFCNKKARNWYIKRVEKAVAVFHPDGIAWDMGWSPFKCASASDPNSDENVGMLKVQYRVYHWLHTHYPKDRVVSNLTLSSPSDLYSDAVMIEGGVGGKNDAQVENTDAYNVTSIGWLGANYTFGKDRGRNLERAYIKRIMIGLGTGNSWGEGSYGYYTARPLNGGHAISKFYLQRWPWMQKLNQLALFSAQTNAVPWIGNPRVISLGSTKLTGAVWANPAKLLVAIYDDSRQSCHIHTSIRRGVLQKYGQTGNLGEWTFWIVGTDGTPVKNVHVSERISSGNIAIGGTLGPGELLLGEALH